MNEEDYWKKRDEKEWKTFWKRFAEGYPKASYFENKIVKRIEEMFEKISPSIGECLGGEFFINQDGNILSYDPFYIMLGAISEVTQEETMTLIKEEMKEQNDKLTETIDEVQKMQRYLKYAVPELEELIACPFCEEYNPPDKKYCVHCQKELIEDAENGSK